MSMYHEVTRLFLVSSAAATQQVRHPPTTPVAALCADSVFLEAASVGQGSEKNSDPLPERDS